MPLELLWYLDVQMGYLPSTTPWDSNAGHIYIHIALDVVFPRYGSGLGVHNHQSSSYRGCDYTAALFADPDQAHEKATRE